MCGEAVAHSVRYRLALRKSQFLCPKAADDYINYIRATVCRILFPGQGKSGCGFPKEDTTLISGRLGTW